MCNLEVWLIEGHTYLIPKKMNNLKIYGWSDSLLQQKQMSDYSDFMHGRITVTHKTNYELVSEKGLYTCELTGNMMYGRDKEDYPCTGDWVIFQPMDAKSGIIYDMLPRKNALYRLKRGSVSEKQVIASHVDKAFVVQSLDNNFNVRRLERFILQIAEENIEPALILTKADLAFNKTEIENALGTIKNKMPVFYTSINDENSINGLKQYIMPSETVVLTGSSGVGKSSLINALCQDSFLATASISRSTNKGMHTSTRREMVLMQNSGVLIDTPGVRAFGVTNANNVSEVMDIDDFASSCQFNDCQHINEKGCAVISAVNEGEIDPGVYENYLKLRKEAWHYTASVHEKRKQGKSFAKMVKKVKKHKSK